MTVSVRTTRKAWLTLAGTAGAMAIVLSRRWDQIVDPQVWVEEGAQFIPAALERGLRSGLEPVNGYFILTARIQTLLALKLGGLARYPAVSTALGLALRAAILAWIASAPLVNRGGALLCLAVALLPSDTE